MTAVFGTVYNASVLEYAARVRTVETRATWRSHGMTAASSFMLKYERKCHRWRISALARLLFL